MITACWKVEDKPLARSWMSARGWAGAAGLGDLGQPGARAGLGGPRGDPLGPSHVSQPVLDHLLSAGAAGVVVTVFSFGERQSPESRRARAKTAVLKPEEAG
jgi:hypothetical protein